MLDWHSLSYRSGRDAVQLFFPLCLHLERCCHRFLLFSRIMVSCPLPQEMPLCLMLLLYIINTLEVGVLVYPHKSTQAYLAPALCTFCLLSICLFWHLLSPSVRFLGQAHAGCKIVCSSKKEKSVHTNQS
jgi:hypothetical protein